MQDEAALMVKLLVGGCLALWLGTVGLLWAIAAIVRWAVA